MCRTGKPLFLFSTTYSGTRQWHSADRLLVNIVLSVFWFNPVFWLLHKELFVVHEFIADEAAVGDRDVDELATILLAAAFPVHYTNITNQFFTSPIKRRLHMITSKQKTQFASLIRLSVIPVLLILTLAFSGKAKVAKAGLIDQATASEMHQPPDEIRQVVLQDTVKASFPGGDEAWSRYIATQVKRNLESLIKAGVEGTAVLDFVVDERGDISEMRITKLEGTLLAEVLFDAIAKGPKWIPARHNGKNIRSHHKLPLTFKIE